MKLLIPFKSIFDGTIPKNISGLFPIFLTWILNLLVFHSIRYLSPVAVQFHKLLPLNFLIVLESFFNWHKSFLVSLIFHLKFKSITLLLSFIWMLSKLLFCFKDCIIDLYFCISLLLASIFDKYFWFSASKDYIFNSSVLIIFWVISIL